MNIYKIFYLIIFCLISNAIECKKRIGKDSLEYKSNLKNISGEIIIKEFLKRPYSISCIDNLLVVFDSYDGKTISVFDLKNNQYKRRIISRGQGSDEVEIPLDILSFPQKKELFTFQRNRGRLMTFTIPNGKMKSKVDFENHPSALQKMQNYYVGLGVFKNGRFGIYDKKGKLLWEEGKYPFQGEKMEKGEAYLIYQEYMCANPHNNYFAIGSLLCDHLAFYEIQDKQANLLKEYASYDAKAHFSGGLRIDNDCIISYTWAYGTSEYCYMLYCGKTYQQNKERTGGGNIVIVFDWEGNYIKSWETDSEIRTFCIDESNSYMYAVVQNKENEEYAIMRFNL